MEGRPKQLEVRDQVGKAFRSLAVVVDAQRKPEKRSDELHGVVLREMQVGLDQVKGNITHNLNTCNMPAFLESFADLMEFIVPITEGSARTWEKQSGPYKRALADLIKIASSTFEYCLSDDEGKAYLDKHRS